MKNYIQPGKIVPLTAPAGGVQSGDAVLIGGIFGIACSNAVEGAEFECQVEDVFELPKVSAQAWTQGAPLYWDAATKKVTMVAGGNTPIGVAVAAAANPSDAGHVKLVPMWPLATQGLPASATFATAAGGANVCEVTVTVEDAAGNTLAGVHNFDLWLSDAASGAGLTNTTASGTVQAKAASGAVIGTDTAKKALRVQTLATGVFVLEITDAAKTGFYPAASIGGKTVVGAQLIAGNYGA